MTDFCYASNTLIIIYLNFYPKSDELFKVCFFFANGALAVSVGAFRNQMVFHNYDNMSSLALHIFPIIVMWNLRWTTMSYEEKLPESERKFMPIDTSFDFYKFFVYPLGCYFMWVTVYFTINFVVAAKRIRSRNYDNLFLYYEKQPWARKVMYKLGPGMAPVIFITCHFIFFFICHCASIICLYSFQWHTCCLLFWLLWSVRNASNFYMEYFARKYELSLQRLEEVEQQLDNK